MAQSNLSATRSCTDWQVSTQTTRHLPLTGLGLGLAATLSLAAVASAGEAPNRPSTRQPNIVMILADDMGYDAVGCNGSESCKTPNLDALAASGIRFTNAHSMPICTPTRLQLMTGKYNDRNYTRFGEMSPGETTFCNLLGQAGYATAMVGKWQLGGNHEGVGKFGIQDYCLWNFMGRGESQYWNTDLIQNGKRREDVADRYGPDVHLEFLFDFIERKKDKPFIAYWATPLPHDPHGPTPDSKDKPKAGQGQEKGKEKGSKDYGDPAYFPEMVGYLDKHVGLLVNKLEQLKLRDNTIIMFIGDNGTGYNVPVKASGQTIVGGKNSTTIRGTHVPMIVNWPARVTKGRVCTDLIDTTDFLPTMLDMAGRKAPADPTLDGRSFLPQVLGQAGNPREWSYFHFIKSADKPVRAWVLDQQYKLYASGEFYDYRADPEEKRQLTGTTGEASKAKLLAVLEARRAQVPAAGVDDGKKKKKKE